MLLLLLNVQGLQGYDQVAVEGVCRGGEKGEGEILDNSLLPYLPPPLQIHSIAT